MSENIDHNVFVSNTQNRILMTKARESLSGRWGLAVGNFFLFILLSIGAQVIPVAGTIGWYIIAGPITYGLYSFFLNISRNEKAETSQLFNGFQNFGTLLGVYFLTGLFILLWALLLIIPGIVAAFSYSMVYFIIRDNPSIGAIEAITHSKNMMKGNKWKLFCLGLRFTGWAILATFSLFIGFLWLSPYFMVSLSKFYDDLKDSEIQSGKNNGGQLKHTDDSPNTNKILPSIENTDNVDSNLARTKHNESGHGEKNTNQKDTLIGNEKNLDQVSTVDETYQRSQPGTDPSNLKKELEKYKEMLDDGLINQEDYDKKKNELLNSNK